MNVSLHALRSQIARSLSGIAVGFAKASPKISGEGFDQASPKVRCEDVGEVSPKLSSDGVDMANPKRRSEDIDKASPKRDATSAQNRLFYQDMFEESRPVRGLSF